MSEGDGNAVPAEPVGTLRGAVTPAQAADALRPAALPRRALVAGRRVLDLLRGDALRSASPASAVGWDREQVFTDGDAWFDALLADCAAAEHVIDFETYIFARDALGERVAAALAAAAARGVAVRLLVDGVGAAPWVRPGGGALVRAGAAVRVWHPPLWVVFAPSRWPRLILRRLWRASAAMRRLNRRDHRKVCMIDGRIAWVGSFNVDGRHLRSLHGDAAWRDCGARVEGAGVPALARAFARAWRHAWSMGPRLLPPLLPLVMPLLPRAGTGSNRRREAGLVRLNDGLRVRRRNHADLIARIAAARRRVWITSPYFLPSAALLRALARAAANGADVRVVVPARADVVFMPWIAAAFAHRLAKLGVHMAEYLPGMIHAKTIVIDDWACVGSTNLNQRSWLHDLEADVVVTAPASRIALERAFAEDLARARPLGAGPPRPSWQRLLGRLGLFFAYWL
jgi:cardiolipin synthase